MSTLTGERKNLERKRNLHTGGEKRRLDKQQQHNLSDKNQMLSRMSARTWNHQIEHLRKSTPSSKIEDILAKLSGVKMFRICGVKHRFWTSDWARNWATSPLWLVSLTKKVDGHEPNTRGLPEEAQGDVLITWEWKTQKEANKDRAKQWAISCLVAGTVTSNGTISNPNNVENKSIGHLLTSYGLCVDSGNVQAIPGMPRSTDVKGIERLVVEYLSKSYGMSDDYEVLGQLTQKESMREQITPQESAFQRLKHTSERTLLFWSATIRRRSWLCNVTHLNQDWEQHWESGKPVVFGSRVLTLSERGHTQNEQECLTLIFRKEKLHEYSS